MYRLHRSLHNDDHGRVSFYDLIYSTQYAKQKKPDRSAANVVLHVACCINQAFIYSCIACDHAIAMLCFIR